MGPSEVISLAAILSGAAVSLYSLNVTDRHRREDRKHDIEDRRQARADKRAERAIGVYTLAEEMLRRMDPEIPDVFRSEHGWVDTDELHGELEWLSLMGWTEGIRSRAETTRRLIVMAQSAWIMFKLPLESRDEADEEQSRAHLANAVDDATAAVVDLRREIRESIE